MWREGTHKRVSFGADVMYALASSYIHLHKWDEAIVILKRCLQIMNELGDEPGAFAANSLLAIASMRVGDRVSAKDAIAQGIGGPRVQLTDVPGSSVGVSNIVSTMINVRRHEDALRAIGLHETNLGIYRCVPSELN